MASEGAAGEAQARRVQELNDALRRHGRGGRVLLTAGVAALPSAEIAAITQAVATFDAFGPDNDPYGEHDCAVLTVGSDRILWKIDAYDRSLAGHSPDPAVTVRVLTIMLAEEF